VSIAMRDLLLATKRSPTRWRARVPMHKQARDKRASNVGEAGDRDALNALVRPNGVAHEAAVDGRV